MNLLGSNESAAAPQPAPERTAEPRTWHDFYSLASRQWRAALWPTVKYLTRTEVHTYSFSVAANAILSFFPFMVLLMTVAKRVLHSRAMYDVIIRLLWAYLPVTNADVPGGRDLKFIVKNLEALAGAHQGVQIASVVMLLISSTGVFLPLEVALNQVWGFSKNRNYLHNQLVSLGLAVACGVLALSSVALTAGNSVLLGHLVIGETTGKVVGSVTWVVMKAFAVPASIAVYFLIYWLLPNGKIRPRWVLPAAISAGLVQEVAKYVYILALPHLEFNKVYGPFALSVTLMLWAFISGLLLLGGAHLSAAGKAQNGTDPDLSSRGQHLL